MEFINIADLKDPADKKCRSYREVNGDKKHKIPLKTLVELENGAMAFVVKLTRDCDMTPLYSVSVDTEPEEYKFSMSHGYDEESLTVVDNSTNKIGGQNENS